MRERLNPGSLAAVGVFAVASLSASLSASAGGVRLDPVGVYETGQFGVSAAEIVTFDPATQRLFVVNATSGVDVLSLADPANPVKINTIHAPGTNSAAVSNGLLGIAVQAATKTDPGTARFYSTAATHFNTPWFTVGTGALPDMITFSPDGRYAVVANEAEPSNDYGIDPEGSITVIDVQGGFAAQHAVFTAFNGLDPGDTRIFGPGATNAQDLEPEYIAITKDSKTAYVALQENNAIAVVDLPTATVTDILPLGFKDHSVAGNELDPSDRDGGIGIKSVPVYGMYLPDSIAVHEVAGKTYIVTANEGDSRDYPGFCEEQRVKDAVLDPVAFPNAADLQKDESLGRLKITTTRGDTDGDGDFDELYAYGGRSFSIFLVGDDGLGNATLTQVFDSGAAFEQLTAKRLPDDFNAGNEANDDFDGRSDDKGPEPEALTLGTINGRIYAFVGFERVGGTAVYDITDPSNPVFVDYRNVRNFAVDVVFDEDDPSNNILNPLVGDLGPEGCVFIKATDSPNGRNLLVVANEVSGTVRVFEVTPIPSPGAG